MITSYEMNENFKPKNQETKSELDVSDQKCSNILENINSVVYYTNENGYLTFISKSVQNVFGYQQEELLGRHFLEFVAKEDSLKAKSTFTRLAIEKKGLEELHLKSKDGKPKLVKLIHAAVFEETKFTGEMGIVIDISRGKREEQSLGFQSDLLNNVREVVSTINLKCNSTEESSAAKFDQQLIENALQEVEHGLHIILDKSPIMFYSHTPDNIINFVSTQSKKLLGFDPEEVKTRWIELLTDNPANQKGIELTKKAVETGMPQGPYEIEMRNIKNDIVWFEVHEIPIVNDGKTVLMVGSLKDITERKKVEEELQTNQSLLTAALEMSSMGHWEYDVATDTFTFNDQFYKMLRTSINEIGSYTMSATEYVKRFVHPEDISFVSKKIGRLESKQESNIVKELEHRIVYADGNVGNINVRIGIVKDKNGKTIKTYGVNQDITKRKNIENELIEAKEKAEESNRLKSILLANMSHELRTPMVGVLGFADILMGELNEPSHIEMVSIIKNSGTRLISTLNSILDLSRIEANKQDINNSPVNLNEIIKELIQLYSPIIKSKKLYLKYALPEKDVLLNSDKDILPKIFNNLMDNAVKYTEEGGIDVKLTLLDKEPQKKILVDITDTGIGIPKEYHKIIFEPFRQVSEGYSRKFEGTGLGLNITKKFVELLRGTITLKSEPGKGSTFTITFPYTKIEKEINSLSENNPVKNEITNPHLNELTVLLVEDDPINALVISSYLKDYLKVDHVSDGQTAIEYSKSKRYDAVLMDINLKGIDGIETHNQIRSIDYHYFNIPIIAVTAYAMLGDREKFLSLGFTHYLSKPFERSQLLILMKEIFKKINELN